MKAKIKKWSEIKLKALISIRMWMINLKKKEIS